MTRKESFRRKEEFDIGLLKTRQRLSLKRTHCLLLNQVCKHWKGIMERQEVCNQLWEEVIVDFGHELITAVHTPIAWSDQRPGEDEFKESFSKARLDSGRILAFLAQRRTSLKHVTLMNSEGYYSDVSNVTLFITHKRFSPQS